MPEARNLSVAAGCGIPRVGGGEVGLIFVIGFEEFAIRCAKYVVGIEQFEETFVVVPREENVGFSECDIWCGDPLDEFGKVVVDG